MQCVDPVLAPRAGKQDARGEIGAGEDCLVSGGTKAHPECNALIPFWHHAQESKTPAAKSALSVLQRDGPQEWELTGPGGEQVRVEIQPRLVCGDFQVMLEAARKGVGVALLPEFVCAPAVARGDLEVLLRDWSVPEGIMHFVYPSRRGMLPAVRALVDFLAERLLDATQRKHEECRRRAL